MNRAVGAVPFPEFLGRDSRISGREEVMAVAGHPLAGKDYTMPDLVAKVILTSLHAGRRVQV